MSREDKASKWYKSAIIYYPIFYAMSIIYVGRISMLPSEQLFIFGFGLYWIATSVLSMCASMFFLRLPFVTAFVNKNNYELGANFTLLVIGVTMSFYAVIANGINIINEFYGAFISL